MSNSKGAILGLVLAVGFGIFNGIATFGPEISGQRKKIEEEFAAKHGKRNDGMANQIEATGDSGETNLEIRRKGGEKD